MRPGGETAPLLAPPEPVPTSATRLHRVTLLLTGVAFVLALGSGLLAVPTLRVLEDIVCRRRYHRREQAVRLFGGGGPSEDECKGDDVQAELSFVVGIQSMVDAVPSLLLAIPYGLLADRIGRKPVLALSIAGMIVTVAWLMMAMWLGTALPVWAIWTSSAWQVVGGGASVMIAMVYSMIADVEPPDMRANAFYLTVVGTLLGNLVSVPISTQLMQRSPWIPLFGGLALAIVGCACVGLVPETLPPKLRASTVPSSSSSSSPRLHDDDDEGDDGEEDEHPASLVECLWAHMADARDAVGLLRSRPVAALVLSFAVQGFTDTVPVFAVQYMSARFRWPLARAGGLLSVSTLVNVALHLVLLPGCARALALVPAGSSTLGAVCKSPDGRNLLLARASAVLLVAGAALLASDALPAVAAGLVVFTLGSGMPSLCRALATALVADARRTARLYSLISVVQACSALSSGPVIAWLFGKGLALGGAWLGLPYFGVMLLCIVATVAVFVARLPAEEMDRDRDDGLRSE